MQIMEARGGYLYQHRPDVIPQGWMTDEELALWAAFYEHKKAQSQPTKGARRG